MKRSIKFDQKFDSVEWKSVVTRKCGVFDALPIYYISYKNGDQRVKSVFVISTHLSDECGWDYQDKIEVFQNPKDITQFKLVKTTRGYTLSNNNPGKNYRLQISKELITDAGHRVAYDADYEFDSRTKALYVSVDIDKAL